MMNRLLQGFFAGCVATFPMSLVMQLLHRWPFPERDSLPPQQITKEVASRVGAKKHLSKSQLSALTLANHFAFGAGAGGIYALLAPRVRTHPVLKGTIWGLVVWSGSYLGWLPAAHILRPATQASSRRNFLMIFAHLVWGITTALIVEKKASENAG